MYTLNPKYAGMYRMKINGNPVKEHIRSVDVFLTARYNKDDQGLLKIRATSLDGKVIEFETNGKYPVGQIVDEICDRIESTDYVREV